MGAYPLPLEERIILKSPQEIERMRSSNRIVAEILQRVVAAVRPGARTRDLNALAEDLLRKYKARSAFKGYNGYPAVLCTSVNEEVVHGIPSDRVLKEGDIVSLDFGAVWDDYYGMLRLPCPWDRSPRRPGGCSG